MLANDVIPVKFGSLVAGLSVAITFLWHVMFFGACMAISGYAEQKNHHAITQKPVLPVSESGMSPPLGSETFAVISVFCDSFGKKPCLPIPNRENLLLCS